MRGTSVLVGGESLPVPELQGKLGHFQTYFGGVREKRAELRALLEGRRKVGEELRTFLSSLRAALVGLFGPGSPVLETFGFRLPRRHAPLTAEQRLAKAARLRATRALRHTLGSRQKAAIREEGTPIISAVFPDAAPAAEPEGAPAAAPVAPASPAAVSPAVGATPASPSRPPAAGAAA
ncbi:hypothetical protein HY251_12400 [bacterium]|nr:hypothetical protein [bacterium]